MGPQVPKNLWAIFPVAPATPDTEQSLTVSLQVQIAQANTPQQIDLGSDLRLKGFTLQGLYIDTSIIGQAVTITVWGTQQLITVKANTQGYYRVIAPAGEDNAAAKLTVQAAGAGLLNLQLLNGWVDGFQWPTQ